MTGVAPDDRRRPRPLHPALRPPPILVIGYGNPGRGDDGLGPAAAAAIGGIGWPNVTVMDNYQLAIEDSIEVARHDLVWFVDAAVAGERRCTARRVVPAFGLSFTSHLLEPAALLAIAEQQFEARPEAWLLSIRGHAFGFGEGLSQRARSNLAQAVAMLRRRIARRSGRAR